LEIYVYIAVLTWGIHRAWLRKTMIKNFVDVVGTINGIRSKVMQCMKHPAIFRRIVPVEYKIVPIAYKIVPVAYKIVPVAYKILSVAYEIVPMA
jgi:hypothetical protein